MSGLSDGSHARLVDVEYPLWIAAVGGRGVLMFENAHHEGVGHGLGALADDLRSFHDTSPIDGFPKSTIAQAGAGVIPGPACE